MANPDGPPNPAPPPPRLDRLRRKIILRITQLIRALIDREVPWRDWQTIPRQLRDVGFHDVDSEQQSERELIALLGFLDQWLELLALTDGIIWPDEEEERL